MRIELTVRADDPGAAGRDGTVVDRQLVVECEPGTRADTLATALAEAVGFDRQDVRRLVVDGQAVPPKGTVGMPPLLAGAVVELRHRREEENRPPRAPGKPTARWELRVESGPDVGRRLVLPTGASVLGRDRRVAMRLHDPSVSRCHAEVTPSDRGVVVRDLGGANETSVGGRAVGSSPRVITAADRLRIGSTTLSVHPLVREARHLPADGEGHLLVDPVTVPRSSPPAAITLPGLPPDPERSRFPWLALVLPLVLAAVLALVMHAPTMLLFGLSGPVLSFAAWASGRRGSRRRSRDEAAGALAALRTAEAELGLARAAERQRLLTTHPALATLLGAVESRSRDLWARAADRSVPGPLEVRLGVGSPPSRLPVVGETAPSMLADAPVTLDLVETDLVVLQGSRLAVQQAAVNLVCRLAAQHGPGRVEIHVMVGDVEQATDWSFARLLPHVGAVSLTSAEATTTPRSSPREDPGGRTGTPWLDALVASTAPPHGGQAGPHASPTPRSTGERDPPERSTGRVVVLDGGPAILRTSAARTLLGLASESRITLVSLGASPVCGVPPSRTALVSLDGPTAGALVVGDQHPVRFVPDLPGPAYAWQLARALAPLRETGRSSGSAGIPERVRLLDLVAPDSAAPEPTTGSLRRQLETAWTDRPRSTRAVLGVTRQGSFTLDLGADGPHALVGGTTGSGKSELLQTLVASLALANRPDELTFVLVDYKGGAAFAGCAELPHVVGCVTDLDAHLTRRALLSLGAEVRRRERILAAAGVPDLDAYQRRRDRDGSGTGGTRAPIPRLVIVIDEFRVLAEELPDFVPGLVRLAAVGRSLGIHLVLATQRPSGIVSAEIRANVSIRIALRVRDRSDSTDLIERPDAAAVAAETPGRAFLVGADTALTELQTAQVTGAPPTGRRLVVTDVTRWWESPLPLTSLSDPPSAGADPAVAQTDSRPRRRDLDDIVAATRGAARTLGATRPPAPWLPPLPDAVALADLVAPTGSVPVGLVDVPDRQAQECWCWPMDGHLGITGGPGSGRTTALLTIAGAAASSWAPTAVHLYAIGSPALEALTRLPHTAAVAALHDADHVGLVVEQLSAVVRERVAEPAGHGRPRVLVLVDGWEQLADLAGGSVGGELRVVLEVGRAVGVVAVVTGGRSVLSGQLASVFSSRLLLRVADPVELALAGVPAKAVPVHQPPGRAVVASSHQEMQIALLGGSTDRGAQAAELATIALGWSSSASTSVGAAQGRLPQPVRPLPTRIRLGEIRGTSDGAVLGVREGDLLPVHLSPHDGQRRFVVVGPPGSGRTTTLATLALGLVDTGHPVAVVGSALRGRLDVTASRLALALSGVADDDVDRLIAARRSQPSLCVLVDDVERTAVLDAVLREITRLVDIDGGLLIAATTPDAIDGRTSPLIADLERARTGLLLWPRPGSHQLGQTMPRRPSAQADPAGRGVLVRNRTLQRIQVATA